MATERVFDTANTPTAGTSATYPSRKIYADSEAAVEPFRATWHSASLVAETT